MADKIRVTDTYKNVKIIHLQRLANPLLPYDADSNPYRTIDSMSVDLTTFNGLPLATPPTVDPKDTGDETTTKFYTRERGETNGTTASEINLWRQEEYDSTTEANGTLADATNQEFNNPLHHTLGYLNFPYGTPSSSAGYIGDPQTPFSWLMWLNRPYVSPFEVMQVSWLRSSQLLDYYNMNQGTNPYDEGGTPFPHLTNYFLSKATTSSPQDEELHRVFEYLGVPSPFVGTETQANPATAAVTTGHNFRPPFNGISTYREPGKINLNTIYSKWVLSALQNRLVSNTEWSNFVRSRRGYGNATPPVIFGSDDTYPTEFGKPFRSFGGADMVPTLTPNVLKYDKEIDATILREGTSNTPLFQYNNNTDAAVNTDRNPYFRYQGIQRLGNLVTTRSNVYAVWITVGYFEVEPAPGDLTRWPDGYALARELGMDTGEIERHRAFYIFDRSIPVAFQRGQDLNIDKAILVDRFIE